MNALEVLPNRIIFQTRFGRPDVCLVKCRHDVKRQPKQLETNENHQQFLAAHEQHQANGCQKNNGQVFPGVTRHLICLRQQDREKCRTRQIILNSEFSGVITSIPLKSVALRGKSRTVPIAIRSPSEATNAHAVTCSFG